MKCYLLTYLNGFKRVVVLKDGHRRVLVLHDLETNHDALHQDISHSPDGSPFVSCQLLSADDIKIL